MFLRVVGVRVGVVRVGAPALVPRELAAWGDGGPVCGAPTASRDMSAAAALPPRGERPRQLATIFP
jgi:hypothetical protein